MPKNKNYTSITGGGDINRRSTPRRSRFAASLAASAALALAGGSVAPVAAEASAGTDGASVKTVAGAIARIQSRVRKEQPLSFVDRDDILISTRGTAANSASANGSLELGCLQKPVKMKVAGEMFWFLLDQTNTKKARLATIKARPLGPADAVAERPIPKNTPTISGAVHLDPDGMPVVPVRDGNSTSDFYVANVAPCTAEGDEFGFHAPPGIAA